MSLVYLWKFSSSLSFPCVCNSPLKKAAAEEVYCIEADQQKYVIWNTATVSELVDLCVHTRKMAIFFQGRLTWCHWVLHIIAWGETLLSQRWATVCGMVQPNSGQQSRAVPCLSPHSCSLTNEGALRGTAQWLAEQTDNEASVALVFRSNTFHYP